MNYSAFFLFSCYFMVFVIPGLAESKKELIQKYLRETLDNPNYDKRIVPDGKGGPDTPVVVNVTLNIFDINSLNELNMDFEAQIYLRQIWVDPRLQYNIPDVNSIILTDVDKIWTPDLFFPDEKEGSLNKITQPNILCKIKPDGSVFYRIKIYEKITCEMQLHNFPHDIQRCGIRFESFGFTTEDVVLRWLSDYAVSVTTDISAYSFEFDHVESVTINMPLTSGNYSVLKAVVGIKRNIGFSARKMYTPLFILVVLSWLSFWIRSTENNIRMVFLIIVLYLMLSTVSDLDRWIPYTPYTKASDIWIGFCEAMVLAALTEFIFVATFLKKESEIDSSSEKFEMSSLLDNESKEITTESLQPLSTRINSTGNQESGKITVKWSSHPIDRICRFAFPIIFILFNIIYFTVYSSA